MRKMLFTVPNGIFSKASMVVSFGWSGKDIYKELTTKCKKSDPEIAGIEKLEIPKRGEGNFFFTDKGFYLCHLAEWDGSIDSYGTLTHELVHAAQYLLHKRGAATVDEAGISETLAYQVGYWYTEILQRIRSKKK